MRHMPHPNYPYGNTHGTSSDFAAWWIPHREMPEASRPGQVAVTQLAPDLSNFTAVVDDFGTLRRVAS